MQNEDQQTDTAEASEAHIKQVMGPTAEESKPVSVPNESALTPAQTGQVVEPDAPSVSQEAESTEPEADQSVDDATVEEAFEDKKTDTIGLSEKLKHAWRHYWRRPHAKVQTAAGIAAFVLLIALVPPTRYFVLNNVGVRSSTSIAIYDETTKQPLKNVQVTARGITAVTGSDGKATLQHIKLGRTKLQIKRRAFAEVQKTVTLGWGSNPLGNIELKPVGAQYSFLVTDLLSNKPVELAEAGNDELSAVSDKEGKLVLTIDESAGEDLQVAFSAKDYRTEKITINANANGTQNVKLVSGRSQPFISNQSGKYDLYKTDIDGKNETVVLRGTGNEQPDIGLITHPTEEVAVLISTRENVRNKDGFLLSTLTFVDLEDNSTKTVAQSEKIQVIGWVGSKMIYAQIAAGASAANASRQKLVAYDYKTQKTEQLAASNSFNDLLLIGKDVYYAPSNTYTPSAPTGLYKITADSTNKQTVLDKEVWNIFRSDYSTLNLSVQQDWYQYKLESKDKAVKQATAPANQKNRLYINSPDGRRALWVDERDGKGTLVLYDVEAKTEKVIASQAGLISPVRWLSNGTLVYRIRTPQETADYVLNTDGGGAKKIRDITHTDGIDRWYYY